MVKTLHHSMKSKKISKSGTLIIMDNDFFAKERFNDEYEI